jgi:hypothetical protein
MSGVREHFIDLRDPESGWAWHSFLSEGVEATLGVQGYIVCPWAEE